jgi:hypothetical protein
MHKLGCIERKGPSKKIPFFNMIKLIIAFKRPGAGDWRMQKKQHMRWTRRGAQMLLHARCALLNGELGKYTGGRPQNQGLHKGSCDKNQ